MRGCLIRLLLIPLIVALLYPLLSLRSPLPTIIFPAEGAEVAAVISGLFLWFAVLSFLDMRRFSLNLAMVNRGIFREGERIVVSGPVETEAPLLQAPFSGQECVAYHYKVTHTTKRPKGGITRWTDYEGFALVPATLKSPLGKLRILADPGEELFYEIPIATLEDNTNRCRHYLETATFDETVNGPGDFRVDKIIGTPSDLEKCDFQERLIQNGELILVEGIYSSEHRGIAPDPDSIMKPFHLIPGGESGLKKKIRNRLISMAVGTGLCGTTIAIYFFVFV